MRIRMVPGWRAKVRAAALPTLLDITSDVTLSARANIIRDDLYVTGDLLASVRQQGTRVYIGTDHWHFIEYGTSPHPIYPNVKRALWWPGLPHPVGKVNHPGNKEYAPMRRALHQNIRRG